VALRIEKSLDALKRDDINIALPPPTDVNPVWVLGLHYVKPSDYLDVPEMVLAPLAVRAAAFAYTLLTIKGIALQYGFCKFVDAEGFTEPSRRSLYPSYLTSTRGQHNVYYRHPIEGHTLIDTFAKAMEIYGYMLAAAEPQDKLNRWFEIAMGMKGAPSRRVC
jgi:hypothetical protein